MVMHSRSVAVKSLSSLFAVSLGFVGSPAFAGGKHKAQGVIYLAPQAPVAGTYAAAPAAVYAAPAVATYAQAPVAYPGYAQAPVAYPGYAPTYAAPTYTAVSTTSVATVASAPVAGSTVAAGNAPAAVAGSRLKAVDRSDIVEELRTEMKENGTGSTRDRRKSLRDSARTKFADSIGVEENELNTFEEQDLDAVTNSLIDSWNVGSAPGYYMQSAPVAAAYPVSYAPAPAPVYYQQAPTAYIQPVVPVPLFVPVQPKHHLFK